MIVYLLVVAEDGNESYSLWKTRESAESERKSIMRKFGNSICSMDIVELEVCQ